MLYLIEDGKKTRLNEKKEKIINGIVNSLAGSLDECIDWNDYSEYESISFQLGDYIFYDIVLFSDWEFYQTKWDGYKLTIRAALSHEKSLQLKDILAE